MLATMFTTKPGKDLLTEADFHQAIAHRGDFWYSACLRITRNPDLAADAVQDALLNAWRKRQQFQQKAQLDTWIHRIAINAALTLVRTRHPERWSELESEPPAEQVEPDELAAGQATNRQLNAALARLSEMERVCFVLKHQEQWKLHEIADELQVTVGTVKQAVFRGVGKLRLSLAGHRSTA